MASTETRSPSDEAHALEVFEQVCEAAGVGAGAERIGVLLMLTEPLQIAIFKDAASRLETQAEAPSD